MLGYPTVRKQNITHWCEPLSESGKNAKALMLSQELKAMAFDKEVFLCRDVRQRGRTVDRYQMIEHVRDHFVCSSGQVAR